MRFRLKSLMLFLTVVCLVAAGAVLIRERATVQPTIHGEDLPLVIGKVLSLTALFTGGMIAIAVWGVRMIVRLNEWLSGTRPDEPPGSNGQRRDRD